MRSTCTDFRQHLQWFKKGNIMDPAAAKLIGAGLAAIGVGLAALGVGNVFGSFLDSELRTPAPADGPQGRLFLGFSAAELLGPLAFVAGPEARRVGTGCLRPGGDRRA